MRRVFADTFHWLALFDQNDQYHRHAKTAMVTLRRVPLVTTEGVLVEFLAALRDGGPSVRTQGMAVVRGLLANPQVEVRPQTHDAFMAGLELYDARPDKGYSLTDCISMQMMRQEEITEVLTHDHHFAQEGFVLLL
jgi:predicted nucleic acid-binding protein